MGCTRKGVELDTSLCVVSNTLLLQLECNGIGLGGEKGIGGYWY